MFEATGSLEFQAELNQRLITRANERLRCRLSERWSTQGLGFEGQSKDQVQEDGI